MAGIKFPPNCEPVNRSLDETFLEEHLMGILYYFTDFPNNLDNIIEYDNLWRELNEIGKMDSFGLAPILATYCATEILRTWIETFACVEKPYADCYLNLYKNVIKQIENMDPESRGYMWQNNLLQVWSEKGFFRISLVDKRMNESVVQKLFADSVKALLQLGSSLKHTSKVMEHVQKGLRQMVLSSTTVGRASLKEILMPLFTGNSSERLLMGECVSYLSVRQCQFLCSLISRRILLNHRHEIFGGMELHIAEKLLAVINNFEAFEPLVLVATKASLNCFHRDHERVLRILTVLILRYTEKYANTPWESLELEVRKKIQLMVSRFKSAMVNSYSKFYPTILMTYGSRLLQSAPTAEIKFRFLQIFQYYIKNCRGDCRGHLMDIFDKNIN